MCFLRKNCAIINGESVPARKNFLMQWPSRWSLVLRKECTPQRWGFWGLTSRECYTFQWKYMEALRTYPEQVKCMLGDSQLISHPSSSMMQPMETISAELFLMIWCKDWLARTYQDKGQEQRSQHQLLLSEVSCWQQGKANQKCTHQFWALIMQNVEGRWREW